MCDTGVRGACVGRSNERFFHEVFDDTKYSNGRGCFVSFEDFVAKSCLSCFACVLQDTDAG